MKTLKLETIAFRKNHLFINESLKKTISSKELASLHKISNGTLV